LSAVAGTAPPGFLHLFFGRPFLRHAVIDRRDLAFVDVRALQLDVIERYIDLRTLPGDRILTPFMGVGSEVYVAVTMGRFGVGVELKPSYFEQAKRNLAAARDVLDAETADLLTFIEA
jgi:hypothetical protein